MTHPPVLFLMDSDFVFFITDQNIPFPFFIVSFRKTRVKGTDTSDTYLLQTIYTIHIHACCGILLTRTKAMNAPHIFPMMLAIHKPLKPAYFVSSKVKTIFKRHVEMEETRYRCIFSCPLMTASCKFWEIANNRTRGQALKIIHPY